MTDLWDHVIKVSACATPEVVGGVAAVRFTDSDGHGAVFTADVLEEVLPAALSAIDQARWMAAESRGDGDRCGDFPACSLPAGHAGKCALSLDNVNAVDRENARRLAAEAGHGRTQP